MARILVVEDDRTIADIVLGYLRRDGHLGEHAIDGPAALAAIASTPPDMVILDVMIPGVDGLEVCRRIRAEHPDVPVLMLTALNETDDRIAGLEVGADDYLAKPFSPRELVLRVDSLLRRTQRPTASPPVLVAGPLVIDTTGRKAARDGRELVLTVRELDLLAHLAAHPGKAFSRAELMREVWGTTYGDQSTVTVHVRRLREKVERDPTRPELIQTVWGIGYRFEATSSAPTDQAGVVQAGNEASG